MHERILEDVRKIFAEKSNLSFEDVIDKEPGKSYNVVINAEIFGSYFRDNVLTVLIFIKDSSFHKDIMKEVYDRMIEEVRMRLRMISEIGDLEVLFFEDYENLEDASFYEEFVSSFGKEC